MKLMQGYDMVVIQIFYEVEYMNGYSKFSKINDSVIRMILVMLLIFKKCKKINRNQLIKNCE